MRLSNNIFNFIKMINNHETTNQNYKALICILVITNVIAFVTVFVLFGEINLLQEKLFQTSEILRMLDSKIAEIKSLRKEVLATDKTNRNFLLMGMFVGKFMLAKLRIFK